MAEIHKKNNDLHNYDINKFLEYKDINNFMIPELKPYIYTTENITPNISSECKDVLNLIANFVTKGSNPNDIDFRNTIKRNINKLNQTNYEEILDKLNKMNFSSELNVRTLVIELLSGSIIVPIAFKGYPMNDFNNTERTKTVPELCASILREFCSCIFKVSDDVELNVHSITLRILKVYFDNYMNPQQKMDENNNYNSDNYKGFMSFMGLLYVNDVVTNNIALECLRAIIKNIFLLDEKKKDTIVRSNVECTNLYNGYQFLLNFIIYKLKNQLDDVYKMKKECKNELKSLDPNSEEYNISTIRLKQLNEYLNSTFNFIQSMINNHQTILGNNTKYKSYDNKNNTSVILRPMSLIVTKSLGEQLNSLLEKFPEENAVKYVHQ